MNECTLWEMQHRREATQGNSRTTETTTANSLHASVCIYNNLKEKTRPCVFDEEINSCLNSQPIVTYTCHTYSVTSPCETSNFLHGDNSYNYQNSCLDSFTSTS